MCFSPTYDKAPKRFRRTNGVPSAPQVQKQDDQKSKMLRAFVLALAVLTSPLLAAGSAFAQEAGEEGGIIYQRKTIINFGEDTIDGDLLVPDGEYVESRKRVRHSNLIRIREDFREKVLRSISVL